MKAIDPGRGDDAEPALEDLFAEWRSTAARGVKAPHETVGALFAQALGSAGQEAAADFGVTPLALRPRRRSTASPSNPTGGGADMRPLHLAIEGLRSFRSRVSIDFTGRDHVAIVGDTGAGKSSILEAITYALYGQTTFTAQGNQELMNDTSLHLRVVLRFRVSGEAWEVARTLRRDGQGRVGPATAQLRRVGADGEAVEQVEQVKPVNDRIKALIGLDSDAFLRTVVLPQGRFARLLVEDRPTDRGRILRQVWRTDELEAAGDLAGAARREAETLPGPAGAGRLGPSRRPARASRPPGGGARIGEPARRRRFQGRTAAATAREAVLAAETAQRTAAAVTGRLRALDTRRAAGRLEPVAALDLQLRQDEAALTERQSGLEAELACIPTDDGPTAEEVAAALTTLESLGSLATAAEDAAAALAATSGKRRQSRRTPEAGRTAPPPRSGRRPSTRPGGLRWTKRRGRRGERRDAVEQQHAGVRNVRPSATTPGRGSKSSGPRSPRARSGWSRRGRRSAGRPARPTAPTSTSPRPGIRSRRRPPPATCIRGDDCPICRRGLPADWEAPEGAGLAGAEQVASAAHAAAREATRAVTALGRSGGASNVRAPKRKLESPRSRPDCERRARTSRGR